MGKSSFFGWIKIEWRGRKEKRKKKKKAKKIGVRHFIGMEKRYAERRTPWLWMLWKRKLFAQYWMRFESTRDNGPKREQVRTQNVYNKYRSLFHVTTKIHMHTDTDRRLPVTGTHIHVHTKHAHCHIHWLSSHISHWFGPQDDSLHAMHACVFVCAMRASEFYGRVCVCLSFVCVYTLYYKHEKHFNYNLNWNIIAAEIKRKSPIIIWTKSIVTRVCVFLPSEINKKKTTKKEQLFSQTPIHKFFHHISLKKYVVCQFYRHRSAFHSMNLQWNEHFIQYTLFHSVSLCAPIITLKYSLLFSFELVKPNFYL